MSKDALFTPIVTICFMAMLKLCTNEVLCSNALQYWNLDLTKVSNLIQLTALWSQGLNYRATRHLFVSNHIQLWSNCFLYHFTCLFEINCVSHSNVSIFKTTSDTGRIRGRKSNTMRLLKLVLITSNINRSIWFKWFVSCIMGDGKLLLWEEYKEMEDYRSNCCRNH